MQLCEVIAGLVTPALIDTATSGAQADHCLRQDGYSGHCMGLERALTVLAIWQRFLWIKRHDSQQQTSWLGENIIWPDPTDNADNASAAVRSLVMSVRR